MQATTPFGHRLENELANEYRRMDSEWFFRWHALNYGTGQLVDVDRFDGGRIRIGGVEFWGSTELVYWDAVARYIHNKINEVFERTEQEMRTVGSQRAAELAEDTARALAPFFQRILAHAVDTDRRLKGRGFPDKTYASPHRTKLSFVAEIEQRKKSLIEFYSVPESKRPNAREPWFEKFFERHKGKFQLIGAIAGACTILGLLGRAFGLF
jgi:hypothetical protein